MQELGGGNEAAEPKSRTPKRLRRSSCSFTACRNSASCATRRISASRRRRGAPPNPALVLNNLICEGTRLGFHVIATCDTYNNVNRFLSRKAFSEFEMRVLFQMSANDSASLIDNPKASTLGLHRALFYNEQEGYLETFRPYALPAGNGSSRPPAIWRGYLRARVLQQSRSCKIQERNTVGRARTQCALRLEEDW